MDNLASTSLVWATPLCLLTPVAASPHNDQMMPIIALARRSALSEPELVDWFRRTGENDYFESLYLRCRRRVHGRCLSILKDSQAAEDATHETFLRAFNDFQNLQGDNFSAWVYRIATNLSLNRVRDDLNRQRILKHNSKQWARSDEGEENLLRREKSRRALGVLAALKDEQREVLTLKYVQGCSYSEIEEKTGFSYDQVRSYLQNGRRNFRILWADAEGNSPK